MWRDICTTLIKACAKLVTSAVSGTRSETGASEVVPEMCPVQTGIMTEPSSEGCWSLASGGLHAGDSDPDIAPAY